MYYLIIFFVAASGGGAGGDIETLQFTKESTCIAAAKKIVAEADPWRWSHVDAICVRAD